MQNLHETMQHETARDIAAQFAEMAAVEAVALGGSLAAGQADARSDIDLYVFSETPLPLEARACIIEPRSSRMELGAGFWGGTEDYWFGKKSGVKVEAIYEGKWMPEALRDTFSHNRARTGYSTSLRHSVATARVLFDRTGWFASLQKIAAVAYPNALADAIIRKNFALLRGSLVAYPEQIALAVERNDVTYVHHCLNEVFASYFAVLFALNRALQPGGKRQLAYAEALALTPEKMRADVTALVTNRDLATVKGKVDRLIDRLAELLESQGAL